MLSLLLAHAQGFVWVQAVEYAQDALIHFATGEQDVRRFGSLGKRLSLVSALLLVASGALACSADSIGGYEDDTSFPVVLAAIASLAQTGCAASSGELCPGGTARKLATWLGIEVTLCSPQEL